MRLFYSLRNVAWGLFFPALALVGFGLLALWPLAETGAVPKTLFWKQLGYGVFGGVLALAISFLNMRVLRKHGSMLLLLFALAALSLAGLFLFGEIVRGTRGWYRLWSFGIAPVEFVKVVLIVFFAKFFSDRHQDLYTVRHIAISFLYMGGMAALVLAQPDAGSALVLTLLWLGMVLFAGIRWRWVIALIIAALLLSGFSWTYALQPYQKDRIATFLALKSDPRGFGYNALQSRVAVGSGGLWGKGFGEGSQGTLRFLPEAPTDFIFAVISEEGGLVGVFMLSALFLLLWYRTLRVGLAAQHNFGRLVAFGFMLLTTVHFFINAGMNVGLLPVVGLPLPFVSYGGSHILAEFIGLGIVLAIAAENRSTVATQPRV